MLEVVLPGLLTTVQDGGRRGYSDLGVPSAGACDPLALAVANGLLGNPADAAALEMTLAGPTLRVLTTCVVALAGADFAARVEEDGRRLQSGGAYLLRGGTTLVCTSATGGARGYLALAGGIAVPPVLGSAATYLAGGFGGLEGRLLRAGDHLLPAHPGDLQAAGRHWPDPPLSLPAAEPPTVRVVPGPHLAAFVPSILATLTDAIWTVGPQSDRMGLRLQGPTLIRSAAGQAELLSLGMVWGALQVPSDGQPIALLADHQTVGGYPVPAVAIRANWPILGQLAPGAAVRFSLTDIPTAQAAYRAQQAAYRAARAQATLPDAWEGAGWAV